MTTDDIRRDARISQGVELSIGEVARRSGIARSAISYYEGLGLLPEPRRAGDDVSTPASSTGLS